MAGRADWAEVEPLQYLAPFLEVIRSPETSGPITGVALTSVRRLLSRYTLGARPWMSRSSPCSAMPSATTVSACVQPCPPKGAVWWLSCYSAPPVHVQNRLLPCLFRSQWCLTEVKHSTFSEGGIWCWATTRYLSTCLHVAACTQQYVPACSQASVHSGP